MRSPSIILRYIFDIKNNARRQTAVRVPGVAARCFLSGDGTIAGSGDVARLPTTNGRERPEVETSELNDKNGALTQSGHRGMRLEQAHRRAAAPPTSNRWCIEAVRWPRVGSKTGCPLRGRSRKDQADDE